MGTSLRLLVIQAVFIVVLAGQETGKQRRILFSPTMFTCPKLTVVHGSVKCTHSNAITSQCTTTCATGYKAVHSKITCTYHAELKKSAWTATPSCKATTCPKPPSVSQGALHCPSSTHVIGQVCTLSCSTGYRYTSSNTAYHSIRCLSTGAWSTHTSCKEIRCPAPSKISHGSYLCSPSTVHTYGQKCSLTCSTGFKPSTSTHSISCLATSKWSTSASCVEIRCPTPPKVTAGTYQCTSSLNHKLNDACHLHCSAGYKPSSTRSDIKCLSTSAWSAPAKCVEIRCPTPAATRHGTFHCSSATVHAVGSTCGLTCSTGYRPNVHSISCLSDSTWSAQPVCTAIRCPTPKAPQHGSYRCSPSPSTHKPTDTCSLTCTSGYTPSTHTITCLSDATWSAVPSCTQIRCPSPAAASHGSYKCSSASVHTEGETCTLTCATGYTPSTSTKTITCRPDSTWTASAICVETRCSAPPTVTGGVYKCVSATANKMNDVCHLHCNTGYKPSSSHSDITCLSSRAWSAPSTCVEIMCPTPPSVSHGTYLCASTRVHRLNDVCHLRCSSGYKPSSTSSDVRCLSHGAWSAVVPCVEIRCPSPQAASHGSLNCSSANREIGSTCNLTCAAGYEPSVHTISCLADATWSEQTSCIGTRCPSPAAGRHGSFNCSSPAHSIGSACSLHCAAGYEPSVHTITCLHDATWSEQTSCIGILCPRLSAVSHGSLNCSSPASTVGSTCRLTCAAGYQPSVHIISCLADATWSEQTSCIRIRCPAPTAPPDGSLNCSSTTVYRPGDTCDITCATGYTPSIHIISCLPDATWSARPTCVDSRCPNPPTVQHGMFKCSDTDGYYQGDTCDLLCDAGYRPSSTFQIISCRSDNMWSPSATCVEISCPVPLPVNHGSLNCSSRTVHPEGGTCRVACDEGYRPNVHTITCLGDATWSDTASCNETLCPPPPVTPHGSFNCSDLVHHKLGDTCKLTCRTGYSPLLHTITCLSDSTWSDSTFCVDSTPPAIECPVGHSIALLPNETGTKITWPKVTATDFPSGVAIPVTLTSSIGPGSNVTVGAYTVTYAAVDEAGNRAEPCSFLVIVSNSCPKGSSLSVTKRQCRACPVGAYQQHKDSLGCVPCPDGFSTSSEGSSSPSSCRGICGAGSFSSDGLEPCSLCPLGTYQGLPGSQKCDPCPQGKTTQEGAKNMQDCSPSFT